MANRKLKNFEFANHSEKGKKKEINTDQVVFFESPNGSVFLVCQDNNDKEVENGPASLASQRIRYYLENEFVVNPVNALYNALVYTNGFLFEYGRKTEGFDNTGVHCACILIRDNQAYYSVFGNTSIYFFNGNKTFLLAKGEDIPEISSDEADVKNEPEVNALPLLGLSKTIKPEINIDPLVPLNSDILLMCTSGFYEKVSLKNIQKILADPMPVQTKVYRFIDMASLAGGEENVSVQLISFYNLDHQARAFKPAEKKTIRKATTKKKSAGTTTQTLSSTIQELKEKVSKPGLKHLLIAIAAIVLGYMFYDLFIHDPMPPVKVRSEQAVNDTNEIAEAAEQESIQSRYTIPGDTLYQVRAGDNWSRIYTRFGVCSWFIRSHPDNTGRFDNDDNPVAGRQITIPLIYSAREEFNPDFFRDFSLEQTGSRCENANQDFVDAFKARYELR